MNIFTALNSLLLLFGPVDAVEAEIQPASFRIQIYPYGGYYYSYPPCPSGYYSYGGRCWYGGPGYYGRYRYPYYRRYYYRGSPRHRGYQRRRK